LDLNDKSVLVIGGAGFIGSHIVDQLTEEPVRRIVILDNFVRGTRENIQSALKDPRVELVEGSIMDLDLLKRLMKETDCAFHLAALWLYECVHEPRSAVEINALGTYNVIEAAQEGNVEKVIFSSSASVYGDALFTPMTEDHPFNNRTMYGATKIAGEQFFRAFNEQYGLGYVGLRYMNVYGPRQPIHGAYTSVITSMLERLSNHQPLIVHGDGSQTYDFVYVKDAARANLCAASSTVTKGFYNVGRGEGTSILSLAHLLMEITGMDVGVEFREDRDLAVQRRIADIRRAQADLGFKAEIELRTGIQLLVDWWQANRGEQERGT